MEYKIEQMSDDSLQHYGVLGMKWGVRRYQNEDGTYTDAGLKRYFGDTHTRREVRAERKADNAKAFDIGKNATIYGKALEKSTKKSDKAAQKLEKAKESGNEKKIAKAQKKADMAQEVTDSMREKYNDLVKRGEEHFKELVDKWGEENVKELKYVDTKKKLDGVPDKLVNERVVSGGDIAKSAAATVVANSLLGIGKLPAAVLFAPKSASERANDVVNAKEKEVKKEHKANEKAAKVQESKASNPSKDVTAEGKFTDSYKKSALQKAKDSDVYNIDFLEAVQNKPYLHADTPQRQKTLLSEYERFLEDPRNYKARGKDE